MVIDTPLIIAPNEPSALRKTPMINPIDYDWQDEKLHRGRLLLGDPIAASVQVVMDYASRINLMNEGITNYDLRFVLAVWGQKVIITRIRVLGKNSLAMYYPSSDEWEATCLLTDVKIPCMYRSYFEKLKVPK